MKSSIALTTYNGSKYIVELLDSIKNQTRIPDEVIIIDDVSTDNTFSIIEQYINKNCLNNWKVILNETNIGWKKNFRKAVQLCKGDILFFCDQDDIWHKDKLETMCSIIESNNNVHVLVSNYVFLSQGDKRVKSPKGSECDNGLLEQITGYKRIGTISRPGCTFAFTKEIAELLLRYDNLDCAHDHVVYNLGIITDSLYLINRQLIDFRRHNNNASTNKIKFGKQRKVLETKERVDICDILLNYCKKNSNKNKENAVIKRKEFYFRRMCIFDNGNIFSMLAFILTNVKNYGSIRDMAVDFIAMTR